ncbi:hypothetical protein JQ600_19690, partial [Bradyrhizobium sp. AUGA SZCCT0176]|uniref:beta strand repeat-containing protein n=1 Tax=Bradyrhizobium sp. AUGA SZCCT0176 TaxID=2807664 RepID=UPI0024C05D34
MATGASGETILNGTTGSDNLVGGSGNDCIYGSDGADKLNGGSGDDTLNGGSGFDDVKGGSGTDLLIFNVWENQWRGSTGVQEWTSSLIIASNTLNIADNTTGYNTVSPSNFTGLDTYDGGTGSVALGKGATSPDIDTLRIVLGEAQLLDAGFMAKFAADIAALKIFIINNTSTKTLQTGTAEFLFTSINLKISQIETFDIRDWKGNDFGQSLPANVTFGVTVASEASGNDASTQSATISEENTADDTGTFTIAKGGDVLTGPNTASVTVTMSGTASDADFNAAVIQSIANGATAAGLTVSGQTATTVTLTWGAGDPNNFNVNLTAFNDQLVESGQTLSLTLSGQSVSYGTAVVPAGQSAASLTITEIDQAVSFSMAADQTAISEEAGASVTFTISLTGFPLNPGNSATVDVAASGSASGGTDYSPALLAALQTVADATAGVSLSGSTLTFDSSFVGSTLAFTVSAVNDDLIEGTETIVATLSNQTIVEGTAAITTASDSVDLTEIDQAVSFSMAADQTAISEEAGASVTFTISLTGFPLNPGNSATVDVAASGSASGGTDYSPALLAALQTVADATAGVSLSGSTLTFDSSFVGSTLAFTVSAVNDDLIEGTETIVATLSNQTIVEGTAAITTASDSVDLTEIDQAV